MVSFRTALGQVANKILPTPRNDSLPNPMRNVAPDTAKQQIEQEIPFRSSRDAVLQEYLAKYTLKSAGIGFVTPPYSSLCDRIWGVTPVDDLPKLQALYEFNPYVAASVDVRVNLTLSNQQIALFQAGLTGDLEARAKLGLPEEIWGNLATMHQGYDQTMPAGAVSKSVASQLSPQLSASKKHLGRIFS